MHKTIALKLNRYFYYGWVILFISAVSYFFSSPGQTYSISVFINSYISEFGYSRTLISSIYSFATIASGILMIFIGKSVDRLGSRYMLLFTGISLSLACLFNSIVHTIPMIFIGFFLLRLLGQGSLTLISSSLVPQWFEKRRAFAISLLSIGTILGNLVVPTINHTIIQNFSWKFAWLSWSGMLIFLYVPIIWLFIVNKPEDLNLFP